MTSLETKNPKKSSGEMLAASETVTQMAQKFRLPTVARERSKRFIERGYHEALEILAEVFELETQDRLERRIERLRKAAKLPPDKTFHTLDWARYPKPLQAKFKMLAVGDFVDRTENVIAFGLPGVGKTHVAAAIGHALVAEGRSVYYTPTFKLIQELLAAKRDLDLPRMLRKLDNFDALILDDIGYTRQSEEEIEVLFTLLAERYERKSVIITSNLVFSQWEQIFKNPMTTAAAIDRVVHHAVILEFKAPSYRAEKAKAKKGDKTVPEET